jgi:hypothetical protein
MAGQAKSEASSLSSAEVGRLWEEPTEASGENQAASAVGILAALRRGGRQSRGESTRAPHLLDLEVAHVRRLVRELRLPHTAPARRLKTYSIFA